MSDPGTDQTDHTRSQPQSDDERPLYGLDFDEYLHDDPESVYELWADDRDVDDRPERLEIIEWSVVTMGTFLPDADRVIDRVMSRLEDEPIFEEGYEAILQAADDDVRAAFKSAVDLWSSKIHGWRQADKELRRLIVTWNEQGEPLLDGEPMYVKAVPT